MTATAQNRAKRCLVLSLGTQHDGAIDAYFACGTSMLDCRIDFFGGPVTCSGCISWIETNRPTGVPFARGIKA